jgi:DNA helicase-2/ATP-dependent DNA helicase PcrA
MTGLTTTPRSETETEGSDCFGTPLACAEGQAPPAPFDPTTDGYRPDADPRQLVVLGPPGTGKSTAALRDLALPALRATSPSEVLACSFTRSAAGVLRERLAHALGGAPRDYRASARTVHSEALRLVVASRGAVKLVGERLGRAADDELRLPEQTTLGSPEDGAQARTTDLRTAALRLWDLARNRRERDDLRRAYALIQPVRYSLVELMAAIGRYEAAKRAAGEIDFVDLLEAALDLPAPQRELLLVDEVQDCSPLQWALVERWGTAARWFVLVGDPDQSVHRWCGAAPERLLELASAFDTRRLVQSFRVPRSHHALAVPLIQRNRRRLDAPYAAAPRDGSVIELPIEEALIEIEQAAVSGVETLVLARSSAILARHASALSASVVPFAHERGYSPLSSATRVAAVKGVLALRSGQALSPGAASALLEALPAKGHFPPQAKAAVCRQVEALRGPTVAPTILVELGARLGPLSEGTLEEALLVLRLHRAFGVRRRLAHDLATLVERRGVAALMDTPTVTLTTMHGAKGREAPLVVVDLEAPRLVVEGFGRVPAARETERQLLYVALTRSRERLLLVRHPRRDLGRELGLGPVR